MSENAKKNHVYVDTDTAATKSAINAEYGIVAQETIAQENSELEAPSMSAEQSAISSILSGDVTSTFNVIAGRGEFSARESYQLTRPDDETAISIGKAAKNAEVEFERFLVYSFEVNGETKVGIVILGNDGHKYVTTSAYFIKEFLLLCTLYESDGETLTKIRILHKESKNKTADGQKMYYPFPQGL